MSASRSPTTRPRRARATARLTVTDDLPTPPLPDDTARTRAVAGMSVDRARSSWALRRARSMSALRSAASISPMTTSTGARRGGSPPGSRRRVWSWVRRGQPATVRATSTSTRPSASTATARTMPRSTMLSPSSGSITPSNAARTVSSAGGEEGAGTPPILPFTWSAAVRTGRLRPARGRFGDAARIKWCRKHVGPGALVGRHQVATTGGGSAVTTMSSVSIGRKPSVITLTDGAVAKVADLLAQEGNDALALRVAVRPGGCSGYSYEMFFDSELSDDDVVASPGHGQGGGRLGQRRAAEGLHPRLHRRPAGRRVPHLEPQRHPHLRVRLLLQLTHPGAPASAPTLSLRVDGVDVEVPDDGASLLEVLRERLGRRRPRTAAAPRASAGAARCGSTGRPGWPA